MSDIGKIKPASLNVY